MRGAGDDAGPHTFVPSGTPGPAESPETKHEAKPSICADLTANSLVLEALACLVAWLAIYKSSHFLIYTMETSSCEAYLFIFVMIFVISVLVNLLGFCGGGIMYILDKAMGGGRKAPLEATVFGRHRRSKADFFSAEGCKPDPPTRGTSFRKNAGPTESAMHAGKKAMLGSICSTLSLSFISGLTGILQVYAIEPPSETAYTGTNEVLKFIQMHESDTDNWLRSVIKQIDIIEISKACWNIYAVLGFVTIFLLVFYVNSCLDLYHKMLANVYATGLRIVGG